MLGERDRLPRRLRGGRRRQSDQRDNGQDGTYGDSSHETPPNEKTMSTPGQGPPTGRGGRERDWLGRRSFSRYDDPTAVEVSGGSPPRVVHLRVPDQIRAEIHAKVSA